MIHFITFLKKWLRKAAYFQKGVKDLMCGKKYLGEEPK